MQLRHMRQFSITKYTTTFYIYECHRILKQLDLIDQNCFNVLIMITLVRGA